MASNFTAPVLLVLRAGSGIGRSVADAFAAKSYKIALAARCPKPEESTADELHIQADFSIHLAYLEFLLRCKKHWVHLV
jgi:NAD(P)-dependent dehydrogenase (short-subunit alcohol dehydrogenase family)